MIDRTAATAIARERIARLELPGDDALVLIEDRTLERAFGWVFFYASRHFLETRDERYRVIGNAPLIVDRSDGTAHFTGTAGGGHAFIEDYERRAAESR